MRRNCLYICLASILLTGLSSTSYGQKQIKDPLEYSAYITAFNEATPAKKAAAMEAFITTYPNSVVREDALEQAMGAYQADGNSAKVLSTAQRILDMDADAVRALAIVVFIKRNDATKDPKVTHEVEVLAGRGIDALPKWTKPADMSDADFTNLKTQATWIFNGAAG